MRAALRFAGGAAGLFGTWLLLVGTNAGLEELAGGGAALLVASFGLAVARTRSRRIDLPLLRDWLRLVRVPPATARDSGLLVVALVRRRRGRFRTAQSTLRGATPAAAGRRALATFAGTVAPNTYVVDVDRESGDVLVHDLDRRRAREFP